jgi:formylglycine-generating enzyme required for sulfatase activity
LSNASAQTIQIPAGSFTMGSKSGDPDEAPEHSVSLSAFSIDKTEVTAAQYDSCVRAGACTAAHYTDGTCEIWTNSGFSRVRVPDKLRSPTYPVVCVTWYQAQSYCRYKSKRLPTEAQWEYAALARRKGGYTWGDLPPNSSRCISAQQMHPAAVGSYPPNGFGISDMTGNVWEWSADRYANDYYGASPAMDPAGPDVGQYRVVRGGGWYSTPTQLRIKNRQWFEPNFSEVSLGFRCVR